MPKCPICGSEFSNIAGAIIKIKQETISVCQMCYAEWNSYGQLTEESSEKVVKIYRKWEKGLEEYCQKDDEKEMILEEMNAIYSKCRIKEDKRVNEKNRIHEFETMLNESKDSFLITSSHEFEGYEIKKYYTIISASTVMGTGVISEISASISDSFGMTSNAFEKKMDAAKEISHRKLALKAYLMGANAVIGVDFDYLTIGNNMIAVSANGTPVVIQKK